MTNLNPEQREQIETVQANAIYSQALVMALAHGHPEDIAASAAAILQAAFIMATADLSAERRAGLFLEDK